MESGSLKLSIKQLRKFKFIHLYLHHNIANACECIIFVRCLNGDKNNQLENSTLTSYYAHCSSWRYVPNRVTYASSNRHILVNFEDNCIKFSRNAL